MDQFSSTTLTSSRKRGKHLTLDERGMIQALHRENKSLREIARAVGCSYTTVHYELKRGTPQRRSNKGPHPVYTAKRGQKAYEANRKRSKRPYKIDDPAYKPYLHWVADSVRNDRKWSLDACAGHARLHNLFDGHTVCTKTLYNMLRLGKLPLTLFDVPQLLGRRRHGKGGHRKNKRVLGDSIEIRPKNVEKRAEIGHWEFDTVVGKRDGKESVVLTCLERSTRMYRLKKIASKDSGPVIEAMKEFRQELGENFSKVFKTITADNGSEFAELSQIKEWGTGVYFTHPFSSWEKGSNERHNGLLRRFIPKGKSIDNYSAEDVMHFSDQINGLPRKILDYHTPEELFEEFLDEVYTEQ